MTTTGQRLWDVLSICDVPVFIVVGPTWSKTIIPSKVFSYWYCFIVGVHPFQQNCHLLSAINPKADGVCRFLGRTFSVVDVSIYFQRISQNRSEYHGGPVCEAPPAVLPGAVHRAAVE